MSSVDKSQEYCLQWNNHNANQREMYSLLLRRQKFVDVTLSCSGQMIKCHRIVLATSSVYLEELLDSTPCAHPVIILKMNFRILKMLVKFIYYGEVNVHQSKMNELLLAAEYLKIRGLCGVGISTEDVVEEPTTAQPRTKRFVLPKGTTAGGKSPIIPLRGIRRSRVMKKENDQVDETSPIKSQLGIPRSSLKQEAETEAKEVETCPIILLRGIRRSRVMKKENDQVDETSPIKSQLGIPRSSLKQEAETEAKEVDETSPIITYLKIRKPCLKREIGKKNGRMGEGSESTKAYKTKLIKLESAKEEEVPGPEMFEEIGDPTADGDLAVPGPSGLNKVSISGSSESTGPYNCEKVVKNASGRGWPPKVRFYRQYTNDNLWAALMEVKKGSSVYGASKEYGIPRKTLRNWMKRWNIQSPYQLNLDKKKKKSPENIF